MSEDPTRIALVGAPTSGKSDVAQKFAKLSGTMSVLDNPVARMESLDYELGQNAGYDATIVMAMEQMTAERVLWNEGESPTVTAGTLIQRMAHIGARLEVMGERVKRLPLPHLQRDIMAHTVMGHLLGFLLSDLMAYHHVFYLPLPVSELVLPDSVDEEQQHNSRVDVGIQQLFDAFFIPAVKLDPVNDPAQQMVDHIAQAAMDSKAADEAAAEEAKA